MQKSADTLYKPTALLKHIGTGTYVFGPNVMCSIVTGKFPLYTGQTSLKFSKNRNSELNINMGKREGDQNISDSVDLVRKSMSWLMPHSTDLGLYGYSLICAFDEIVKNSTNRGRLQKKGWYTAHKGKKYPHATCRHIDKISAESVQFLSVVESFPRWQFPAEITSPQTQISLTPILGVFPIKCIKIDTRLTPYL
jgi:hypothetical protein